MGWEKKTAAWASKKLPVLKTKHLHRVRLYLTSPIPEAYEIVAVHKKQVVAFVTFRNDKEVLQVLQSVTKATYPHPDLASKMKQWACELMGAA